MKIVFASSNAGKIRELQSMLENRHITVVPQQELNVSDIEETGLTFVENALLKARHAARMTGLSAIADDSGLCVPALQGAPGLYSARYAGEKADSAKNIQKLLQELQSIDDKKRQAFFYCVLVFLKHADDPVPVICEAKWHGVVLKTPQGQQGFGYDPVFFDEQHHASAAELPLELKNKISHRGQALRLLLERI